jgi:hypothetical protein
MSEEFPFEIDDEDEESLEEVVMAQSAMATSRKLKSTSVEAKPFESSRNGTLDTGRKSAVKVELANLDSEVSSALLLSCW